MGRDIVIPSEIKLYPLLEIRLRRIEPRTLRQAQDMLHELYETNRNPEEPRRPSGRLEGLGFGHSYLHSLLFPKQLNII